ncbi:esterase OVCA2-like isoform X2 [Littorina saxatilis]|uniref:Serine hydrolase domain-containing protein n=1 Tax=Littorina saxatilis TaxID=31220 RepID=A0AAN9BPT6_9CAEN
MAESNLQNQLKILCIHGYRQNAQAFREKTGAFRKILKKKAELEFISAPNRVPPLETTGEDAELANEGDSMGWWFSRQDDCYHAQELSDCCKGYDQSLKLVQETIKEKGPFDGVLGFSQGAAMVSLLLGVQEQQSEKWFDFAILVAGFKSRSSPHDVLYSKKISIPTLHVFGDTDKVIPKEMSEDLLQYFEDPVVVQHPGGHFVPAAGPQKKVYLEFFDKMLKKKAQVS